MHNHTVWAIEDKRREREHMLIIQEDIYMDTQEFLHKYLVDRHGTDCSKWDGLEEKFGESDLTAMWVADMEFKTCDEIISAM